MQSDDSELIGHAARLLEQAGHGQAATVIRSATRLERPSRGARFSGRWTVWTDSAMPPAQLFEITQQIKRALNALCGVEASYTDLRATTADTADRPAANLRTSPHGVGGNAQHVRSHEGSGRP
jgi:hypothetical protein